MSTQSGESEPPVCGVPTYPLPIFDPPNCDPPPVTLPAPVAEWKDPVLPVGLMMAQDNGASSLETDRLLGQEAIVQMAETSLRKRRYCPNDDPPVHVHVRDPPVPWHLFRPINYRVPSMDEFRQKEWIQYAAISLKMQLTEPHLLFFGQRIDPSWRQPQDPLKLQEAIVQLAEAICRRYHKSTK